MSYFKNFEAEEAKYDNRIKELFNELEMACDELETLQDERTAILRNIQGDGNVTALDSRITALTAKVESLKERVGYAKECKLQQLRELLEGVETTRQQAIRKTEKAYEQAIKELNRKKLAFLADAVHIGELVREINDINARSNECRSTAGMDQLRHWPFENRMTLNASPAQIGFDAAAEKTLAIPEWLVQKALLDELPSWAKEVTQ